MSDLTTCIYNINDIIERLNVLKNDSGSVNEQKMYEDMIEKLNKVYDIIVYMGA